MIETVAAKRLAAAKILSALSIFTPTTNSRTTVEKGIMRWRMRRFSVPPTNPIKVRRWRILTLARNSVDGMAKALRAGQRVHPESDGMLNEFTACYGDDTTALPPRAP